MYHTIPTDRNVHNYTFVLLLAHYDNVRSSCFNNFSTLDVYIPKWLHFIILHNTFWYMFIPLFSFLWSWCNSHNFQCINLSALSCRLLHSFGAKFLHSVTRCPTLSPFSPPTLHRGDAAVWLIWCFTWLVLKVFSCAAQGRASLWTFKSGDLSELLVSSATPFGTSTIYSVLTIRTLEITSAQFTLRNCNLRPLPHHLLKCVISTQISRRAVQTHLSVSASTIRGMTLHSGLSTFLIWTATFPPIQLTVFIYLNWWDMLEFALPKLTSWIDSADFHYVSHNKAL